MRVYLFGFASDDFLGRVIVTPDERTVAQLGDAWKAEHSHRALAARALLAELGRRAQR